MIKISEFKLCKSEPPKKNGYYLVIGDIIYGNFQYACALEYTTEYGWNTSLNYTDSVMDLGDEYLWAEVTFDAPIARKD